jgi:hypothetical protein
MRLVRGRVQTYPALAVGVQHDGGTVLRHQLRHQDAREPCTAQCSVQGLVKSQTLY